MSITAEELAANLEAMTPHDRLAEFLNVSRAEYLANKKTWNQMLDTLLELSTDGTLEEFV